MRYVWLTVGVFACSVAVILIKASQVHPVVLSASRLLMASAILSPVFWSVWRRDGRGLGELLRRSWLGAGLLALHFVSWAAGARMTDAANGSLIVNLVPVVMPLMVFAVFREVPTRREVIGSAIALAGVGLLTLGDVQGGNLAGDVTCFVSMVLVTGYLVLTRLRNDGSSIWLYVIPLYFQAGLMCLALSAVWPGVIGTATWWPSGGAGGAAGTSLVREVGILLGLAVIPTIVGHSLLNHSMRVVSGQVVSVFNLAQFAFAGLMAYGLFGEVPERMLWVSGAMVVAGAVVVVWGRGTGESAK